jgi:hypothetical protein
LNIVPHWTNEERDMIPSMAIPLFLQLLVCVAAASNDETTVLRRFGEYTLVREPVARIPGSGSRLVEKPTELKKVASTMNMRHVDGKSLSSTFVQAMRDSGRSAQALAKRQAVVCLPCSSTLVSSS